MCLSQLNSLFPFLFLFSFPPSFLIFLLFCPPYHFRVFLFFLSFSNPFFYHFRILFFSLDSFINPLLVFPSPFPPLFFSLPHFLLLFSHIFISFSQCILFSSHYSLLFSFFSLTVPAFYLSPLSPQFSSSSFSSQASLHFHLFRFFSLLTFIFCHSLFIFFFYFILFCLTYFPQIVLFLSLLFSLIHFLLNFHHLKFPPSPFFPFYLLSSSPSFLSQFLLIIKVNFLTVLFSFHSFILSYFPLYCLSIIAYFFFIYFHSFILFYYLLSLFSYCFSLFPFIYIPSSFYSPLFCFSLNPKYFHFHLLLHHLSPLSTFPFLPSSLS